VTSAHTADRLTALLPDDHTITAVVVAIEEHGFSVEVVPHGDAARSEVLSTPQPTRRQDAGTSLCSAPARKREEGAGDDQP
jgi:hypothetical protein